MSQTAFDDTARICTGEKPTVYQATGNMPHQALWRLAILLLRNDESFLGSVNVSIDEDGQFVVVAYC